MRAKRPPSFVNVDLEIVSRSKLDSVEAALSDAAHALYSGPLRKGINLLALECNLYPKDADAAILCLCAAVERLGKAERHIWDRGLGRTFDVGYRLVPGSPSVNVKLKPETIRRVTALDATVAFTCYREHNSEPDAAGNSRPGVHLTGL